MQLEKIQLLNIVGGGTISGTIINAIARGIDAIMDVGRSLGTAIRRLGSKKICSL